jgi:hypothetical protein
MEYCATKILKSTADSKHRVCQHFDETLEHLLAGKVYRKHRVR